MGVMRTLPAVTAALAVWLLAGAVVVARAHHLLATGRMAETHQVSVGLVRQVSHPAVMAAMVRIFTTATAFMAVRSVAAVAGRHWICRPLEDLAPTA